jgi:site-specific recombinase XerD
MRLMDSCQRKPLKKTLNFGYVTRSFLGYLEGTSKSEKTIKNYAGDLKSFHHYLEIGLGKGQKVLLTQVSRLEVENYHHFLKKKGLKTNTRRRKILTVRRLLRYLTKRKKISLDIGNQIPAPHKVERIPTTVSFPKLLRCIQDLPYSTELEARNRALLWVLVESGCLVSEIQKLKYTDFIKAPESEANGMEKFQLLMTGKLARSLPLSSALYSCILNLKKSSENKPWVFYGFNRFGALEKPLSPRGIELRVRHYAKQFKMPQLTPRTIRHSVVLFWFQEGLLKNEIQKRLGLKTAYAFRTFEPLLKKMKSHQKNSPPQKG